MRPLDHSNTSDWGPGAQGYLFGRPQPADRVLSLLEAQRREAPMAVLV
jgi:hypothetical protein